MIPPICLKLGKHMHRYVKENENPLRTIAEIQFIVKILTL